PQFFSRSVSVTTVYARAKPTIVASTTPIITVRPPPVMSITSRRARFGAWYSGVGWRSMWWRATGGPAAPRAERGIALAVLRHPVSSSATIARPATAAARMVRSLTDTQQGTLLNAPPPAAARPPGVVVPPSHRNRWWAVPLLVVAMLVLVTIAVAALLPAKVVASKDVTEAGATARREATPYALVPAAAQPVAGRVSYDDVASSALADVDIDTHPDGRVFFVTVSEPAQSLLGRWVGRREPEVDWLTYEDKYGSSTPSQQRSLNLQLMRTSSQVAQYVALSRAGFTEAQVVPGPVQIEQLLCAEVADRRCAQFVPVVENLQDGDNFGE